MGGGELGSWADMSLPSSLVAVNASSPTGQ